jgi:hypothetical protein
VIPKSAKKIHRQFAYVAMMLLTLVLHLQHLFHPMRHQLQVVVKYEIDLLIPIELFIKYTKKKTREIKQTIVITSG